MTRINYVKEKGGKKTFYIFRIIFMSLTYVSGTAIRSD